MGRSSDGSKKAAAAAGGGTAAEGRDSIGADIRHGRHICIIHSFARELCSSVIQTDHRLKDTLVKKKTKFSSFIRKFRWDRAQSLTYMRKIVFSFYQCTVGITHSF
jgi:hypothetical protein